MQLQHDVCEKVKDLTRVASQTLLTKLDMLEPN